MKRTGIGFERVTVLFILTWSLNAAAQKAGGSGRLATAEKDIAQLRADLDEIAGGKSAEDARARLDRMADDLRSLRQSAAQTAIEKNAAETEAARLRGEIERLAAETEALKKTVASLKATVEGDTKSPFAGYDRGFYVRSGDRKFQLLFRGYVRPAYTLGLTVLDDAASAGNPTARETDSTLRRRVETDTFEVETARMEVSILMFQKLKGALSLDFGTLTGEAMYPVNADVPDDTRVVAVEIPNRPVTFMDAYGELKVMDAFSVCAGQFKVPFDLESAFEDDSLVFLNRSLMTRRYFVFVGADTAGDDDPMLGSAYDIYNGSSFGRDVGVSVGGTVLDGRLAYQVGAFNGAGLNRENDNRDVLAAGRISFAPLGAMSLEMSDLEGVESPKVSLGLGVAYDLPLHRSPSNWETTYNSSDVSTVFDVLTKWRGLSAFASIFYRYSDHGAGLSGTDETLHSLGSSVQAAYFISAVRLEPSVRYSFFSARLGEAKDYVHEAAAALQYHVYKEHLRVGIEYRGLFPVEHTASYLAPVGEWQGSLHELGISAEVAF